MFDYVQNQLRKFLRVVWNLHFFFKYHSKSFSNLCFIKSNEFGSSLISLKVAVLVQNGPTITFYVNFFFYKKKYIET